VELTTGPPWGAAAEPEHNAQPGGPPNVQPGIGNGAYARLAKEISKSEECGNKCHDYAGG
jgi:hypothetical protein